MKCRDMVTGLPILSLDEVPDWERFQDLVQAYFQQSVKRSDNQITSVIAKKTGRGSDGGRDILVKMQMNDGIQVFERIWVVQCKFCASAGRAELATVNLPSLLASYKAHGYLLICSGRVTSSLSTMLEELETTDLEKRRCFIYWDGDQFCDKLYEATELMPRFFPAYNAALILEQERMKKLLGS